MGLVLDAALVAEALQDVDLAAIRLVGLQPQRPVLPRIRRELHPSSHHSVLEVVAVLGADHRTVVDAVLALGLGAGLRRASRRGHVRDHDEVAVLDRAHVGVGRSTHPRPVVQGVVVRAPGLRVDGGTAELVGEGLLPLRAGAGARRSHGGATGRTHRPVGSLRVERDGERNPSTRVLGAVGHGRPLGASLALQGRGLAFVRLVERRLHHSAGAVVHRDDAQATGSLAGHLWRIRRRRHRGVAGSGHRCGASGCHQKRREEREHSPAAVTRADIGS